MAARYLRMARHHFIPVRDAYTFAVSNARRVRCGMVVPYVPGKLGDNLLEQQCPPEDFCQATEADIDSQNVPCVICNQPVHLESAKTDDQGKTVHAECYATTLILKTGGAQASSSSQKSPTGPFRHQCLIYEGSPSLQLPALAATIRQMLSATHRCLYLNSPAMVAGMSSCLAAQGTDVAYEVAKTSLVLSSDQSHLSGGNFDVEKMIGKLEVAIVQALRDGYEGLWATGDMLWEFGNERNLQKLLRYERLLEELFRRQPLLCGICQYHGDLFPPEILRESLLTHRAVFINETLSRINPHYVEA